jgi:HK97 family phage prohead protease
MSEGTERRTLSEVQSELRIGSESEPKIEGHAAVFYDGTPATEYELWPGGPIERIMPGAFTENIQKDDDVVALVHHTPTMVLGRSSAGTLSMKQDEVGLGFVIDPPKTQLGRDTVESVRRRDFKGASFGFRRPVQEFRKEGDRTIREIRGFDEVTDVSITVSPAYAGTDVGVRAEEDLAEVRTAYDAWEATQDAARDAGARQELDAKLAGVKARARACEVEVADVRS